VTRFVENKPKDISYVQDNYKIELIGAQFNLDRPTYDRLVEIDSTGASYNVQPSPRVSDYLWAIAPQRNSDGIYPAGVLASLQSVINTQLGKDRQWKNADAARAWLDKSARNATVTEAELSGLLGHLTAAGWPSGTRVILRRERPHPGAHLSFTDADGWRFRPSPPTPGSASSPISKPATARTPGSRTGSAAPRTRSPRTLAARDEDRRELECSPQREACG
jgi:hypothetical protein